MDQQVFSLLKTWCDALLSRQITTTGDKRLDGGILCPACGLLHGRSGDLVFALTVLFKHTGEKRYLDAAMRLSDWTEETMLTHRGLYHNDFNADWYGISAFSADSLFEAIRAGEGVMPEEDRKLLLDRFMALTDRIYEFFAPDSFRPVLNYYAGTAMALTERYLLSGEEKFLTAARKKTEVCLAHINGDGMLHGENSFTFQKSPHGYDSVDLGYNIEETIPFLLKIGKLLHDEALEAKAKELMRSAIRFLLPDGALDNSWGSRSFKWTYYGSRTSDGMQGGLALCPEEPLFVEAAYRNFLCMQACTVDGLPAGGAMYGLAGEPVCTHHAVSHSKALAMMVESNIEYGHQCALPCDRRRGIETLSDTGVHLIGTEQMLASVYTGDVCYSPKAVPLGGTLTLLYHKKIGALIASTAGRYIMIEPKNMQQQCRDKAVECTAPRIERGGYSTVFSRNVRHSVQENSITVKGTMCDFNDKIPPDAYYTVQYDFLPDGVTFTVTAQGENKFVLPLVARPDEKVTLQGNTATVRREGGTVFVQADAPISLYHESDTPDSRMFHPCGGFLYTMLAIPVGNEKSVRISVTVS